MAEREWAALQETTRDLATVIETMNCGLFARDLEGDLVFVNETLLRWLDYEPAEILGRPAEELAPSEVRAPLLEEYKATSQGDVRARLAVIQRKDSTTFPVVLIPQRFIDEQGRGDGSFVLVVDLGAVQTAAPISYQEGDALRQNLDRIALELSVLSLSAKLPASPPTLLGHPELAGLSSREQEVLLHLVGGERVPAIAEHLHISPHTVRNHLKAMFRKLDVANQSELIQHVRALAEPAGGLQKRT